VDGSPGRYSGRSLDYDSTGRGENVGVDLDAYLSRQIIEKLGRHVDVLVFGKKMRGLFLGWKSSRQHLGEARPQFDTLIFETRA
jgi:hypothetical protein